MEQCSLTVPRLAYANSICQPELSVRINKTSLTAGLVFAFLPDGMVSARQGNPNGRKERSTMSLIACTDGCLYQRDGVCCLSRAAQAGTPAPGGCVHFVPRPCSQSSAASASRTLATRMRVSP